MSHDDDGGSAPSKPSHLRIDFVIRELSPDGSVPEDDLRFVRFGEEVALDAAKDFFQRVAEAVGLLFPAAGAYVARFVDVGPHKIEVIKALRVLGGYGLKEAKDLVEAPPGTPILLLESSTHAAPVRADLRAAGATIEVRPVTAPPSTSLPLFTYKGSAP